MRRCLAQNVLFTMLSFISLASQPSSAPIQLPGPLTLFFCLPASGLHDHTERKPAQKYHYAHTQELIPIRTTHSWNADMPAHARRSVTDIYIYPSREPSAQS